MRQETGDMRHETWDMRQETGDMRQEQETWDMRHQKWIGLTLEFLWYKISGLGIHTWIFEGLDQFLGAKVKEWFDQKKKKKSYNIIKSDDNINKQFNNAIEEELEKKIINPDNLVKSANRLFDKLEKKHKI